MSHFDVRLEFIEALVLAVRQLSNDLDKEELDFVENQDILYVKELVENINIQKYPELVSFICDIKDCGYYTNLFLFFDEQFNFDNNCKLKVFKKKKLSDFATLVKKIYEDEKIVKIFKKYHLFFENIEKQYNNIYKFDIETIKKEFSTAFDVPKNIEFINNISFLINGGFSSSNNKTISYVKGIKYDKSNVIEKNEYTIVCMYHEYLHFFINPIIDKYYSRIININKLYEESLNNGLPKTYQNKKTVLYEYFVRSLSIVFAKTKVSEYEIKEDIKWYKEIGFIRVEEIIDIIEKYMENNMKFEKILIGPINQYLNEIKK